MAAAQIPVPAPANLKYRLSPGDRLTFHERIHREVTGKDSSSVSEAEWDTQVLLLSDGSGQGGFLVGTQRNRTRAELLQYREGGKEEIGKARSDFEERLRRRGIAFSEANRITEKGATLLPRVAARE